MNTKRSLFLSLALAAPAATTASAQILLCTDEPPGAEENYFFDTTTTMSVGPLFLGVESISLAADDVNQVLYIGAQNELWSWPYDGSTPPTFLFAPTDPNNGNVIRCEAMAFANGRLFVVEEFGGLGTEGIYEVDLMTGDANPFYLFPDDSIDIGGLSFNSGTGTFFGTNDGVAYPGGRGIVEFDILGMTQTESFIALYPAGITDVDGCAADPAGIIYLIQDEQAFLDNYDLNTGMYDPNPPMSPVTQADTFSGGAWSDVFDPGVIGSIGTAYCMTANNSTGVPTNLFGVGSDVVANNDLTLFAEDMPQNSFGYFLVSMTQGFTMNPGGSAGNICLDGSIGRYVGPGQIQNSGMAGEISLVIDLTALPQPMGNVAVQVGETWNFQTWHRDSAGGSATSNFSNGLEITFN